GQQNKPLWMTEIGEPGALAGVGEPARAAQALAVRIIGFDRWGVPPERSYYWYTRGGTFEFANWLENPDGSWNPQALWLRRYAEETYAKPYASSYHFGSASVGYYGNRYDGQGPEAGKSVSVFMPKGGNREPLHLAVTGKRIPAVLVCRNAWGKATRLPVRGGTVTLPMPDGMNCFIPHSSSLALTPTGTDWGPDLALTASVTTPSNQSHAGLINNGVFENGYDTFEPTEKVFGTDGNWFLDGGTVTGRMNGDTVFPCNITLDLASPKRIGHIALVAPLPLQGISAPVSVDVLSSLDDVTWTPRWAIRQPARTQERFASQQTFGVYCWDYFAGQSTFIKSFSPFAARYVRFRYNQVSQGGQGDALAGSYGGQPGKPQVTVSEIMLFPR
ncbi:MAG: hypothetical protein M3Y13_03445, partial [Armatimonadota bacterium]|nr:hypothetical protein [Armatimonadota bacterium]